MVQTISLSHKLDGGQPMTVVPCHVDTHVHVTKFALNLRAGRYGEPKAILCFFLAHLRVIGEIGCSVSLCGW